jgi:hypothetical protein
MRFGSIIAGAVLIGCTVGISNAAGQIAPHAPCTGCQGCQSAPCGCPGHAPDCCCEGLCQQVPPNPLAPGRPTPPPCCADGICYPNYTTWGHYGTRWRRWPIEFAAPTRPGVAVPRPLGPDVPAYVPPPIEEEDRRAPPPSAPRADEGAVPRTAPSAEGTEEAPSTGPGAPTDESESPPSESDIFGLPSTEPSGDLFGTPPEETPGTTPLVPPSDSSPSSPSLEEPMGDLDLPPSPPFKATMRQQRSAPAATPVLKQELPAEPQDDPPPALPTTLASVR